MENKLEYLHNWVFHYNHIAQEWAAIPREIYTEYWNDYNNKSVLRSPELHILITILQETKGDRKVIEKIFNGKRK
jgi:hypothetical protein